MTRKVLLSIIILNVLVFTACKTREISRIDPDTQTDLSGRWNDTDAKLTFQALIQDMLGHFWLSEFEKANGRRPVVIVGLVNNKTHEHIDPEVFIKDMEKEMINSGKVRIVQGSEFREKLRQERADQQNYASEETKKAWGRELGADFMLTGVIMSIVDQYKKEQTKFYQINMELSNLESNEKVWIGEKEIKKYQKN
jgi:penicillin-binding protein activator